MNFVMCAIGLNKLACHFLIVIIKPLSILILFIMIFGVLIEFLLFVEVITFLGIVDDASRAIWCFLRKEKGKHLN